MKDKTIIFVNRVKLVLAVLLLLADIVAMAASAMEGVYTIAFVFLLLGGITLDYIRITRVETKQGKWFELEDVEVE